MAGAPAETAVVGYERIVLIGFSGTGKSTVGRLVGERLGWDVVDTDDAVASALGMPVPEIFGRLGEAAFRQAERASLVAALARRRVVVVGGGGAAVDRAVWERDLLGSPDTLVLALDARPETSLRRLLAQRAADGAATERPLLGAADPLARIAELKAERQAGYDAAQLTLVVDGVAAAAVAAEIVAIVPPAIEGFGPDLIVDAPSGSSAIYARHGLRDRLGGIVRGRWPAAARAWLVADNGVASRYAAPAAETLTAAGFETRTLTVAAGEGSKSLTEAGRLYDWLLGGGVEQGDVVVALGGGVVGDLAGFVAATALRGLGLVQVPTTLLAMVDSSVGGKTGINHAAGKNLIGAFYQPPLVVIDPTVLATLPPRDLRSGWAEIVKHAVIQPSTPDGARADLEEVLVRNARQVLALEEPATSYLIRRNVALKAAVVRADEREAGVRAFLNFGHTLGHGIEAAGYAHRHGEAVALGMRAAARIGEAIGTCDAATVDRVDGLLDRYGLPRRSTADPERVLSLLGSDKKRVGGRQRWIVPVAKGGVVARDDVPAAVVREALAAVSTDD